jgi:hypothetical protein
VKHKRKNKDKWLQIKVTTGEHIAFHELAYKRHTGLSELIRQLLHREADIEVNGERKESAA